MVLDKDTKTDLGSIKIHAEVINSITAIAVRRIDGVLDLYKGAAGRFFEFLGKDFKRNGIRVVFKGGNEVDINVSVIVEYGYDIPKVANLVQESVKESVESATGLAAGEINVDVRSVEVQKNNKKSDDVG